MSDYKSITTDGTTASDFIKVEPERLKEIMDMLERDATSMAASKFTVDLPPMMHYPDRLYGVSAEDWLRIKRLMDEKGFSNVGDLFLWIKKLEETEKKYVAVVAGLNEIYKVIP